MGDKVNPLNVLLFQHDCTVEEGAAKLNIPLPRMRSYVTGRVKTLPVTIVNALAQVFPDADSQRIATEYAEWAADNGTPASVDCSVATRDGLRRLASMTGKAMTDVLADLVTHELARVANHAN